MIHMMRAHARRNRLEDAVFASLAMHEPRRLCEAISQLEGDMEPQETQEQIVERIKRQVLAGGIKQG